MRFLLRFTCALIGAATLCLSLFSQSILAQSGKSFSTPANASAFVSGIITDGNHAPLSGATVTLGGTKQARTITDAQGRYRFNDLATFGFYTLTPARANYSFSPASQSFSLFADKTDALFSAAADAAETKNPLDTSEYFVRQQYLDFLSREPDGGGFDYWSTQLDTCGADAACLNARRIGISAAFFIELEFQETGSFVYRLYKAGLGRRVSYAEFGADRALVVGGENLDESKVAFAEAFVQRPEFVQKYQSMTTAESFVNALLDTVWNASAVDLGGERSILIAVYNAGGDINQSRSFVLQLAADNTHFKEREYDRSFVLMQYFGYLKREPDQGGYAFWLDVLHNREPDNYRGMVCSFLTSAEYQKRFASIVSHNNAECGQ